MTDDILKLPYQRKNMEDEEYLTALDRLVDTTKARRDALVKLYYSSSFPDDLKDYTQYLVHDSGGAISNLLYSIHRKRTDQTTWRGMYRCLEWIQHIDVLIELVELRSNR